VLDKETEIMKLWEMYRRKLMKTREEWSKEAPKWTISKPPPVCSKIHWTESNSSLLSGNGQNVFKPKP